jgi:hypothetical protein
MNTRFGSVTLLIGLVLATIGAASANGTAAPVPAVVQSTSIGGGFTYQGELKNASGPVNATCAFQFALFNAVIGGAQIGATLSQNIPVADGLFTAQLDFGAGAFSGQSQWLQLAVKCPGDASFTVLSPRQQLTAVPYALSLTPGAKISGAVNTILTIENTADRTGMELAAIVARSSGSGVEGESTGGIGVIGRSPSAVGVQGESTTGTGVLGRSPIVAVQGDSTSGTGVHGESINGPGVDGKSTNSFGVGGASINADGVVGSSSGSGSNAGVYGENIGGGWAGWFEGKTMINGTLVKSAGSFRIDHPLDPANKYLSHSFVESPDMKNIYDGVVATDANGEAVVVLPAYFEALNRDFRYQLTPIGQFAQAIVASEIAGNRFTIKTDKPNVKVSWQVTGIRHDDYAIAYPIIVEEDKPPTERGTYLHPTEQGQPASKGLSYGRQQATQRNHHATPQVHRAGDVEGR